MFKASKITEQRLYELEVPETTETYKPADYKELLHIVKSYNFDSPVTVYSNNGGLASNIIQEFDIGDNELQGVIQITNSYDKTRAFRLRVGAKVKYVVMECFLH